MTPRATLEKHEGELPRTFLTRGSQFTQTGVNMKQLVLLSASLALSLALTSCGSGISEAQLDSIAAEFEAERDNALVLQGRLQRAAYLETVRETVAGGWDTPGKAVLEFGAAVQASDDRTLQLALANLVQGFLASADAIPPAMLGQALAAVQGSGDLEVAEKLQAFVLATASGQGGAELLDAAEAVQASDSAQMKEVIGDILGVLIREQQEEEDLSQALTAQVEASTNPGVKEAFQRLSEPPPEFLQQIESELAAIGDASLEAGFREAYFSAEGDPSAFYGQLVDELRKTVGLSRSATP